MLEFTEYLGDFFPNFEKNPNLFFLNFHTVTVFIRSPHTQATNASYLMTIVRPHTFQASAGFQAFTS